MLGQWLRGRTVLQRIALALTALGLGGLILPPLFGGASESGLLVLASILAVVAFRRELLWRVRNRLILTYVLFGVVPVLLIGWALTITAELLLGQFAAQRVRHDLEQRIQAVRSAADRLALAAAHGAHADVLDEIRQRVPRLSAVCGAGGEAVRLPPDGEVTATPDGIPAGFADLFESAGRYYIGADAREGSTEAFAYLPLDQATLASLAPGVASVSAVLGHEENINIQFRPSGSRLTVSSRGRRTEIEAKALPSRGWWDFPIAGILPWKVMTSAAGADVVLPVTSRLSSLVAGVMTGPMASVAAWMLLIVGAVFLTIEAVSLLLSFRLTLAITRSVDDLYRGTLHVGEGDFSRAIPVRGEHQLGHLATSFNGMMQRIRELIGEVRKKEKLDAELRIARDVQLSLFPKSVPQLRTLEMAAVCIPGRIVSGDYYDYVRLDDRWTALALGDVSGKGVSAALLMASVQSALHARLWFDGNSQPALSTAALMTVISEQLYEHTPANKYVTLFCSMYDDETSRLTYTNAGHLKPVLVREGKPSRLEGGSGMVAGLMPGVAYEQDDLLLRSGDLVAVFSDGCTEAENADGQEFGEGRLAELLVAQSQQPLGAVLDAVAGAVEKWIHDPERRDDLTLLLMRRL